VGRRVAAVSELPKLLRVAIGIRVRAHRKAQEIGQEELADKVEIAPSQISRLEKGHSGGSVYVLLRLAWAFDVEPSDLLPDLDEVKAVFGKAGKW